ncbi:MATE family efflux transporter [Hansschlegelia sp. KR7-227]|uniref:MATE family efflux transporter n=1 Tax=Hansschlegelia sp. KR7-227 TaxID=3400914 RepID=UPI003C07F1B9
MIAVEPGAELRPAPAVSHARVLAIALPMTIASVSTPLLGFVHAAVIGQLGDVALLGAIALAAVLFDVVFWPFAFLRMGTTGLTAQAVGAQDGAEEVAALMRALLLAALSGAVVVVAREPLADLMLGLFGPSPEVEAATRRYYDIRVWSAPAAFANYAVLGWLLGKGRAALGLLLQLFLNGFNAVLTVILVMVLHLSIDGAAIGAVAGEVATLALGLALVGRLSRGKPAPDRRRVLDRRRVVATVAVNRDVFIRTLALLAAYLFFAAQGARAGDATLAANAVLMNLFLIGGYFLDGFATAAEALCGAAVGARDRSAFDRAAALATVWAVAVGGAISALALAGGPSFVAFVATSAEVRAAAAPFLPYAAAAPLAASLAFAMDGVYIGATWGGAMRNLMLVAIAIYFAVFGLASPALGNHGLWLALLSFLLARGLGQAALYPTLRRRTFGA